MVSSGRLEEKKGEYACVRKGWRRNKTALKIRAATICKKAGLNKGGEKRRNAHGH